MKTLSKEQKKIICITAITAIALVFLWSFVYAPQLKRLNSIKEQLKDTDSAIAEVMRFTHGRELSMAIKDLNEQLEEITGILPHTEEGVINNLSESARKSKVEIKNLSFGLKEASEKKIPGYDIEELPISMNLVCEYKSLGEYLNDLRRKIPVLVEIKQLNIKGNGEGRVNLDVFLQISAYLSKEK